MLENGGSGLAPLLVAGEADIPEIAALMNRAYRGRGSEAGWTTESSYIGGSRVTEDLLREEFAAAANEGSGAVTLLARAAEGLLLGCVRLEPEADGIWYLGGLTVAPERQAAGHGRYLLKAAEGYAASHGARVMRMRVVHLRDRLIAWYERRGYSVTEETEAFPYGDTRFGTPLRDDLYFRVLAKPLV